MSPIARWVLVSLVAVASLGCESAIVGSECRAPFVRCGRYCVDLQSDGLNCGACGNACTLGCAAGSCRLGDAGPMLDVGLDGGRDAGRDAGSDAGQDAGNDANVTPDAGTDAGDVDGGALRCGLGEAVCGGSCVEPRDGLHCGDCTTTCSGTDVCRDGACATSCGAQMACGTRCIDPMTDAHHCGGCTTDCGTDVCVAGSCVPRGNGHVVLIGHDFETRRIAMSTLLANAVLLPARAPVRVLAYEGDAAVATITGARAAIAEAAAGRTYAIIAATSADTLPDELEDADTFLVHAQTNATDDTLRTLGYAWQRALDEFLERGGVVVVLEAPSLGNGGTFQILEQAGLLHATGISEIVTPRLVAATGRAGDVLLTGVTFPYQGERHTVRVSTVDPDVIVVNGTSPVVVHRVVTH